MLGQLGLDLPAQDDDAGALRPGARSSTSLLHWLPAGRSPSPTLQQYSTGFEVMQAEGRRAACDRSSAARSSWAAGCARPCPRPGRPATLVTRASSAWASLLPVLDVAGGLLEALVGAVEIGQRQLEVDDLDVAQRIDRAGDVDHVGIVEAAHHHEDGAGLADVGQELVAQALALGGALDQAGDVDDLDRPSGCTFCGRDVLRGCARGDGSGTGTMPMLGSMVQNGIVGGLGLAGRQRVEDGALADVGQTDDSDRESHRPVSYRESPVGARRARPHVRAAAAARRPRVRAMLGP
jgi:hypothetical protein